MQLESRTATSRNAPSQTRRTTRLPTPTHLNKLSKLVPEESGYRQIRLKVADNPVSKGIRRILVYSPFTRPQPWTMAVQSRACAHTQAVASSVCVMDDDVALHAIYRCIFVHDLDLGLKQNLIGAKLI